MTPRRPSMWTYHADTDQPAVIRIPGSDLPILVFRSGTDQHEAARHAARLLTPQEFEHVRRNGTRPAPPHVARCLSALYNIGQAA